MNWNKSYIGNQTIWNVSLGATALNEGRLSDLFVDIWRTLCGEIMPLYRGRDWDVLRIEFSSDNGVIAIYPEQWQVPEDIAAGAIKVTSDWLREYVGQRFYGNCCPEKADEEIEQVEKRIAMEMGDGAKRIEIAKLLGRREIKLMCCFPGFIETFEEITVQS
jgi:hypothetical protein